jgi:hypothetical protein
MIDVKKLVTGFLVLAVAASAAALAISAIGGAASGANGVNGTVLGNANGISVVAGAGTPSPVLSTAPFAGNAFAPQPVTADSDLASLGQDPDPALATSTDLSNLTNTLTEAYLTDLIAGNPSGPTADSSGNQSLTPPDNTSKP